MEAKTIRNIINLYNEKKPSMSSFRILGVLEGILLAKGKLNPGTKFKFKEITYEGINIFFKRVIKTRKQTYPEHLIELSEELISDLEIEAIK